MQRLSITPRADRAEKLEALGFSYHNWDDFWNEGVCYRFTSDQVAVLEAATNELTQMTFKTVEHIIENNRFAELGIPEEFWEPIKASWARDDFTLYGRFDFAYDGVNPPKMLEYNADTPTSLLESAVAQWYWMEEVKPGCDQFNSLHERLVEQWRHFASRTGVRKVHFTSLDENEEDWVCTHYLMETAVQAGLDVQHLYISALGHDSVSGFFVDEDNVYIEALFKLYPWEWMMREDFGKHVATSPTKFIEPLWKALLSNKAMLAIMWELFPAHDNLLPTYFKPHLLGNSYAKKPFFSREGANVELYENGEKIAEDEGPYGAEGHVYQQLVQLKAYDYVDHEGKPQKAYPVVGSWVVGEEAAGMGLREDVLKITTNMSNFIPHFIEDTQ